MKIAYLQAGDQIGGLLFGGYGAGDYNLSSTGLIVEAIEADMKAAQEAKSLKNQADTQRLTQNVVAPEA